ncbi:hypothetical protein KFL_001810160 [Klebsormidium nitens]|uniref:LTD domain-containing protein n=1 Tax=Klebsormidium nitens TaxID=105231 RepID=A0A1Y1I689_KLENI|nr:hypothetical protein KFL_001810160 [Klebsormidium nitens]|eukprot:GAQ84236.1 hypothetical protein KFL_001810160 [Klebsormidium nitens]
MAVWGLPLLVVLLLATTGVNARALTERRQVAQSGATAVFIDEIHWENAILDFGEAVEVFGPLGLDIAGYVLTRYAGFLNDVGQACNTPDCIAAGYEFTFPPNTILTDPDNTGSGAGTVVVVFPPEGLPNVGAQISLSDTTGQVLDYLTYASLGSLARTTPASVGAALGLTPDVVTTQESGSAPAGLSVQRTGATTWRDPPGNNTFGKVYPDYITADQIPLCRVLADGSIAYAANGNFSCGAFQSTVYVSPVTQPPKWADGPRIIGPGKLPDAAATAALLADTGFQGTPAATPAPTTPAPTTPAPTFRVPCPTSPVGGICDFQGPTPNQCFNAAGNRFICCATVCSNTPGGDPVCGPAEPGCFATATPAPTTGTPGPTTSAPAPTTEPISTPGPTTSAPVSTTEPTSTPAPTTGGPTSTPVPTTVPTSTPGPTATPSSTPAPTTPGPTATPQIQPVGGTCDPYGPTPNQCFASNGQTYVCCQTACSPEAPGQFPKCV